MHLMWRLPPLVAFLLIMFNFSAMTFWPVYFGLIAGFFWVDTCGHRYAGHLDLNPSLITHILWFIASCWQVGCPLTWRVQHMRHHKFSGKEGDPHNAEELDWRVCFIAPFRLDVRSDAHYLKPMLKDKLKWNFWSTYKYYFTVLCPIVLFLLFGMSAVLYLWAVPIIAVHLYQSVLSVYISHKFGYKHYDNDATNCLMFWPLLFGSVYHNNHHKRAKGNQAHKWYEFDPAYYIYKLINKL